MTFKELYLSGQIPFEEIDRYISRWNRSDDERTLAKYLGLNADEEDVWIDDSDEALKEMLDKRERVAGTPVTLGKTDIIVNKNGFGALPIQRISFDDAKVLLRKAYDAGVRFFDTAHFQHIFQAFFRNPRHLRAAPWNHQNESFQLQLADRLTDRGTAHAKPFRKLDLHQALARCQLSL